MRGGINRVILATDGDFNVGVTSQGDLTRLIEQERESGVFLTVLGFGTGNLKDSTMEKLADKGNGNYAYIDSLDEARKVLVREAGGTLVTVAKDVKLQVEFNPARVASYRLIGYENRVLADRDFNDDTQGRRRDRRRPHRDRAVRGRAARATSRRRAPNVDPLKYQTERGLSNAARERRADDGEAALQARPTATRASCSATSSPTRARASSRPSTDLRWAAAVAGFGMLLRQSRAARRRELRARAQARELGARPGRAWRSQGDARARRPRRAHRRRRVTTN